MGISYRRTHRDLLAWQEGLRLAQMVYETTATFPIEERYGLVRQMRRAAVSVVSNVAEGAARGSTREFSKFLSIARGSLAELETQVMLAERLALVPGTDLLRQLERTGQLLTALHTSIRARTLSGR